MRYRIGEVADFFGMTKEGIRYLERQGIIRSVRDESNGYRYFPREEITRLKQIKRFQGLGFSLEEAQDLICETSREDVAGRLDTKLAELEIKEQQIKRMKARLRSQQEVVRHLMESKEHFWLDTRPDMLFFPRVKDEASGETAQEKQRIAQARSMEKAWILAAPPCTLGAMHYSKDGTGERVLGSIVRTDSAKAANLPVTPEVVHLPPCLCVCGVLEAPLGERPEIGPMLAYAQAHGYTLCDDIYGVLWLNYRAEDGRRWGIHEFFMPVREKDIKNA